MQSARPPCSTRCCLPPAPCASFARSPRSTASARGWLAPCICCADWRGAPGWSAPSILSAGFSCSSSAAPSWSASAPAPRKALTPRKKWPASASSQWRCAAPLTSASAKSRRCAASSLAFSSPTAKSWAEAFDKACRNTQSGMTFARMKHPIREVSLMLSRRSLLISVSTTALIGAFAGSDLAHAADKSVKVGINLPFTGADAHDAELIKNGALMAIDEANAQGGVAGYKIDVLLLDDGTATAGQYDPAQAGTNARKMVSDKAVVAAIGPQMSGSGKAMSPILSQGDLATITPSSTNPDI